MINETFTVRNNRTSRDPRLYIPSYVQSYCHYLHLQGQLIKPTVEGFFNYITVVFPINKVYDLFAKCENLNELQALVAEEDAPKYFFSKNKFLKAKYEYC